MILSSADILRILGGDLIVKTIASVQIADGKPSLTGEDGTFIYIARFPVLEEFEATWTIWVVDYDDAPMSVLLDRMAQLLPQFKYTEALGGYRATTTEFKSENTQEEPEKPVEVLGGQIDLQGFEDRFQALVEDVQDRMLLVSNGLPGKDGKDGQDGRDGRDIDGTETSLFDLVDVDKRLPLEKGQVLTWDGEEWTNFYIPEKFAAPGPIVSGSDDANVVIISDTAPTARDDGSALEAGDLWWDSDDGSLFIYYTDGDSSQWVQASGQADAVESVNGQTGVVVLDLNDLNDVQAATPTVGQSLVWDGSNWSPQTVSGGGGGGGGTCTGIVDGGDVDTGTATAPDCASGGGGITDCPNDGAFYVRQFGQWTRLTDALASLGVTFYSPIDGGDFTNNVTAAENSDLYDGGNFTTGTGAATDNDVIDGGDFR